MQVDAGDVNQIKLSIPTSTTSWTVNVVDKNQNIIRSWSASTPTVQLAWDGTDAAGNSVPSDEYTLVTTCMQAMGLPPYIIPLPISVTNPGQYALALVGYSDPGKNGYNDIEDELCLRIRNFFRQERDANPGTAWTTIGPTYNFSANDRNRLRQWIRVSKVFYIYSHGKLGGNWQHPGAMASIPYQDVVFFPGSGKGKDDEVHIGALVTSPYTFVMLDCCQSAGGFGDPSDFPSGPNWNPHGYKDTSIAPPDYTWADAFKIVRGDINTAQGAFIGWASSVPSAPQTDGQGNAYKHTFFWWDFFLWGELASPGSENYVWYAMQQATTRSNVPGRLSPQLPYYPWDDETNQYGHVWRAVFGGDILGTILNP